MAQNKHFCTTKINQYSWFERKEIRSIWDAEKEEYYFSVVDVIEAVTESRDSKYYWYRLKKG